MSNKVSICIVPAPVGKLLVNVLDSHDYHAWINEVPIVLKKDRLIDLHAHHEKNAGNLLSGSRYQFSEEDFYEHDKVHHDTIAKVLLPVMKWVDASHITHSLFNTGHGSVLIYGHNDIEEMMPMLQSLTDECSSGRHFTDSAACRLAVNALGCMHKLFARAHSQKRFVMFSLN